ncbi:MAG: ATP-dependent Clp protease proteolytic subunit [Clostridiales bacterium]|nr:ATP-dependent Clp protease proteolytic subunit [Clostridiales bacterium]
MIINPMSMSRDHGDVFSNNLHNGIIYLVGEINDDLATTVIAQMFDAVENRSTLDDDNNSIRLYINSPGGSMTAGLAIYDTMRSLPMPVDTICMGMAASMAAVIFAGGRERSILPHAEVMIHQPSGGTEGTATDIIIAADHIKKRKQDVIEILSERTGNTPEKVAQDIQIDCWMNAEEAVKYGIADRIIEPTA